MTVVKLEEHPCDVCQGKGVTYLEHADGSLSEEVCPYCKGRKNSTWIRERRVDREDNVGAVKLLISFWFVALIFTNGLAFWNVGNASAHTHMFLLHVAVWLIGFVGLGWWFVHPDPKKKRRKPNPLTTDKERIGGAVVLGGALLKNQLEHHHRQPGHQQGQQGGGFWNGF